MEEILSKLLVADNAVIQQGTQELRQAFKDPNVIPALCQVVGSSQNPQIRQYAAVLLRKRLSRAKHWTMLSVDVRKGIKEGILQALINEPEKAVKNSIAQFIGTIVKHEFPNQSWPEVLQFIQTALTSSSIIEKELGMYTLSMITEISADQFKPHLPSLSQLLSNTFSGITDLNSSLSYYTLLTLIHVVQFAETNPEVVNMFRHIMPRIMETVQAMAQTDEDRAVEVMEIFDELLDSAIIVIVPYIKPLIEMLLRFTSNKELGVSLRLKSLHLVGWIVRTKKKSVIKHKLVQPILNVLFELMSAPASSDDTEDYFVNDSESSTPISSATQTLDILALNLPPEKLFPSLLQFIEPSLQGEDAFRQKAAYVSMAVVAEGCAEHIRTKYLESFLQCICKGIKSPTSIVRNAALFALGQFSEHLQPEISQYASELLPILFDYLSQMCSQLQQNGKEPGGIDRMFYALEMFCENLGDELLPYLPSLMDRLFTALNPNCSVHLRELVLSAIGATANAAKEGMIPYFPRIIEALRVYLTEEQTEETICLQIQAVDTLGVIARTIGSETFLPLAQESIQLGMKLSNTSDPDLRKSVYGLFSSIAFVLNEGMGSVLETVVNNMLDSLKSSDGIVTHFRDEENSVFPICDDLSDTADEEDIENESEDEEDDDVAGYSVENSYIEEKEEACLALKELALHCRSAFVPYLDICFEEVFKLFTYPQEEIRKAVIETLSQFCVSCGKLNTEEGNKEARKYLSLVIPKLSEITRSEMEKSVVMTALDAFGEMLFQLGALVLEGEGHRDAIYNCVTDVLTNQTECQDKEDDDPVNEDEEAEQDEMLIECAGNILPHFGKAMTNEEFAFYFNEVYPLLIKRTKKLCTLSQRSFSVGALSECMKPLGSTIQRFVSQLLPLFLQLAKDDMEDVRNNAIFGLGEMAFHGKESVYQYYPDILQTLSTTVAKEKNPGVLDNICGALSRMITVNVNGVPMDQVFPVFINYLPLRQDFEENNTVFNCMLHLYSMGHPALKTYLSPVVKAALVVIHGKQGDEDTLKLVMSFIQMVRRDFPEEFEKILRDLPHEVAQAIRHMLST